MEEMGLQDAAVENSGEESWSENQDGSDRFIRSLLADVETIAEDLMLSDRSYVKRQQETKRSFCRPECFHWLKCRTT